MAVAIFAVLSVIIYGGLRAVVDSGEATGKMASRVSRLQTAFSLMGRNLTQIRARSVRDGQGELLPPVQGGSGNRPDLEFTRGGWQNPLNHNRSDLRRIGYEVKDGELFRLTWQVLDRAQDSSATSSRLLRRVEEIEIRFLDQDREWHPEWPPLDDLKGADPPLALEITLTLEGMGTVRRLFRIGD